MMKKLNSNADRAAARRGVSLWNATIKLATLLRYQAAVRLVLPFLEGVRSFSEVDGALSDWIDLAWGQGLPLGTIGDALSGMQHLWPQCRRQLHHSWRDFRAWRKIEPPCRAPPLPARLASAFLAWCVFHDELALGVLVGLGFHCLLRTGAPKIFMSQKKLPFSILNSLNPAVASEPSRLLLSQTAESLPLCGLCCKYVSPIIWQDFCGLTVRRNFVLISVNCVERFTLTPWASSPTLCAAVEVPFSSSMASRLNKFCCVDGGNPCPQRVSTCRMV